MREVFSDEQFVRLISEKEDNHIFSLTDPTTVSDIQGG